jgi:signal transduction histidine kinase
MFEKIVNYFLPPWVRNDKTHPKYHELRVIVGAIIFALPVLLLFPVLIHYVGKPIGGFLLNDVMLIVIVLSIRFFGHYRIPMTITAIVTYFIVYDWIKDSGQIYSVNTNMLHIYLLASIWADKRYGWWAIFGNLFFFSFIYYQTLHSRIDLTHYANLGGPTYPFVMNCLITIFFGSFLGHQQLDQERDRAKVKALQDQKITLLDDAVKLRTDQLNSMRETMATDFHDQTGNMLSAITRQATLLKLKVAGQKEVEPMVQSIINNSNALYASSKDFLWHLNHDSDDPNELFNYLTSYGQHYYNQFDMAFSSEAEECRLMQFDPSAALNVIFIFKEAMTNVVKHAGATEVKLMMSCTPEAITYSLADNGSWKEADETTDHYGLTNMEKRCMKNHFGFALSKQTSGTQINITVPVENLSKI